MGAEPKDFSLELDMDTMHDLREGLTLTKGWLEAVFRGWDAIDDTRRREMVAAALLGANQMAFLIEHLSGQKIEEIQLPHERMAEEFLRLVEVSRQQINSATTEFSRTTVPGVG
jgi:hypothetical protein